MRGFFAAGAETVHCTPDTWGEEIANPEDYRVVEG